MFVAVHVDKLTAAWRWPRIMSETCRSNN